MSVLKPEYNVVSFSGGKDSTAMLLHMIEIGNSIDEVINIDTGLEFPTMYDHINKIRKIVEDTGIKFTILRADHSFEWYMLEKPVPSKKWGDHKGYGWPTPVMRWCTKHLKVEVIEEYLRELRETYTVIQYIGIASDEHKRLERPHNKRSNHRHPLVDWGWSENDCLQYVYSKGFDWGGLYQRFNRVSCWCCPLSTINELYALWKYYPELWQQLEEWEERLKDMSVGTIVKFKKEYSVKDLTIRFEKRFLAEKSQTNLIQFCENIL